MANSITRELLNKRRAIRDIQEPSWSKRYGDLLDVAIEIPRLMVEFQGKKEEREVVKVNAFESKLDRKIQNSILGGNIYNNMELTSLKDSLETEYNTTSDNDPELRSEFTDSYESRISKLNTIKSKNDEWNFLESEVPLVDERLLTFTNDLYEKEWDDMTRDDKIDLKRRLLNDSQEALGLKRILLDDHNKTRPNYSKIYEEMNAIANSKLALLTQIREYDPARTVITDEEFQAMNELITKNDNTLITAINTEAVQRSSQRKANKEQRIKQGLKLYEGIVTAQENPLVEEQKALLMQEAEDILKKGGAVPKDHYFMEIAGEHVDMLKFTGKQTVLEEELKDLDESYRMENILHASYSETYGVKFPFAQEAGDDADDDDDDDDKIITSSKITKATDITSATNIMDKYLSTFSTDVFYIGKKEKNKFASENNLSSTEMNKLSVIRSAINSRNQQSIDRSKRNFTNLYTQTRTPRNLNAEQLLQGYVIGGLSAEEITTAKKEYSNIEQIKRDFQKAYSKKREQTARNFTKWYNAGEPKLIQKKRGAI